MVEVVIAIITTKRQNTAPPTPPPPTPAAAAPPAASVAALLQVYTRTGSGLAVSVPAAGIQMEARRFSTLYSSPSQVLLPGMYVPNYYCCRLCRVNGLPVRVRTASYFDSHISRVARPQSVPTSCKDHFVKPARVLRYILGLGTGSVCTGRY